MAPYAVRAARTIERRRCVGSSAIVTSIECPALAVYVARYRMRLGAGVVCLVAATSLAMTVPWLWRRAGERHGGGAGAGALARSAS
jgi:hypothetical protein